MGGLGDLPDDVLKQVLAKLSVEMLVCVHRWQWEPCENCVRWSRGLCVIPGLSKDLARIAASDELWRVIVGMRYASELALQGCTCGQHRVFGMRNSKAMKDAPCPVTYHSALQLLSDALPGRPELGVSSWMEVHARLPEAFPTILDRVDHDFQSWQVDQSTGVVTWRANPWSPLGRDRAICSSVPFDLTWAGAPFTLCMRPTTVNGQTKYAVAWTNVCYYEVTVLGPSHALAPDEDVLPCICVGLESSSSLELTGRQPGWNETSFGIHSDDGGIFHKNKAVKYNETKFGVGDTIGCGVRRPRDQPRELGLEIFFTKNGKYICMGFPRGRGTQLETVSRDITRLYPIVGLDAHEISFAANFGRTPFQYDLSKIDADIRREETAFRSEFRGDHPMARLTRSPSH